MLPEIVTYNNDPQNLLHTQCRKVEFPLSQELEKIVAEMSAKFDATESCAGFAAPQLGFSWHITVFAVGEDVKTLRAEHGRDDVTDMMPKTIWFNPSYEDGGEGSITGIEGCFSSPDKRVEVSRFKTIKYKAQISDGSWVEGIARGFLAAVIQHETDHLNGKLIVDLLAQNSEPSVEGQ